MQAVVKDSVYLAADSVVADLLVVVLAEAVTAAAAAMAPLVVVQSAVRGVLQWTCRLDPRSRL